MSNIDLNLTQLYKEKLENLNILTGKFTLFHKFSILIDLILSVSNFQSESNIKEKIQTELIKNSKSLVFDYFLIQDEKNINETGPPSKLKVEIIDNLIGSFSGKIIINCSFKSANGLTQNYSMPLNLNSSELKNLNFEKLEETIGNLQVYLKTNFLDKINSLENIYKITNKSNKSFNNFPKINSNLQNDVFNNVSNKNIFYPEPNFKNNNLFLENIQSKNYITHNNYFQNNKKMENQGPSDFISVNPDLNIDINSEIPENLGIDNNKIFNNNISEIEGSESIKENPNNIGGNLKFAVPDNMHLPKDYPNFDEYDPNYEIFNPNYQINPNKLINPKFNEGNIIPGANNPFFSSGGGMIPGGEYVGPQSDIFKKEHPNMMKNPAAKIRYDPIGPFGIHGGPEKKNKKDDQFFG